MIMMFSFACVVAQLDFAEGQVLSGILLASKNGLRRRDALSAHGPLRTLYNRRKRSVRQVGAVSLTRSALYTMHLGL